jgi:phosphoserine aminotransferase
MRVFNFNAGPAALPLKVLEQVKDEFLDWRGTGMSIVENSHRAKEVVAMADETQSVLRGLMGLDDEWAVLFCQGGASLQFAMIPMNFAAGGAPCDYVDTGVWSTKAFQEAKLCSAAARLAASSGDADFTYIPSEFDFSPSARYAYICANNTVRGTQWPAYPDTGRIPLVADVSSEFLSKPMDLSRFALVFAGAQKNVAPAGLTIVLIRRGFAESGQKGLPHMLDYRTYLGSDSMYNTPPVFAVYVANLVLKWLRDDVGGLEAMGEANRLKAEALYAAIDGSGGFYAGTARADSRSRMNVTFRLADRALEKAFQDEAKAAGLIGLGGHRSVGGLRASLYNALDRAAVDALVGFMAEFKRRRG